MPASYGAECTDAELDEVIRSLIEEAMHWVRDDGALLPGALDEPGEVAPWVQPALEQLAAGKGFPVSYSRDLPGNVGAQTAIDAGGKSGNITVQEESSPVSRARNTMHEIAHVIMIPGQLGDILSHIREAEFTLLAGEDVGDPVNEIMVQYAAAMACACLGIGSLHFTAAYLSQYNQALPGVLVSEPEHAHNQEKAAAREIIDTVRAAAPAVIADGAFGTTGAA